MLFVNRLARKILKIKPCVCEPEVLETLVSFNLELFHFDRSEDELDVNELIKELPNRLKTFNERFLMPLSLALSKPEVGPNVEAGAEMPE